MTRMLGTTRTNKYEAQRCWSELCQRQFDSKLERERGEQLHLMEKAGEIFDLEYQVPFILWKKPSVKVILDFKYKVKHWDSDTRFHLTYEYEDAKGVLTEAARVKYAWLKEKYGIEVQLWPPR